MQCLCVCLQISHVGLIILTTVFEVRATAAEQSYQVLILGLKNVMKPSFHILHEVSWESLWKPLFATAWMKYELRELLAAFPSLLDRSSHGWSLKTL